MASIKRLISKLEKSHGYYYLTSYLGEKFIDEYFLDFLRFIDKDDRLKKEKISGPKNMLSNAIRRLIKSYVNKQRKKMLEQKKTEENNKLNNGEFENSRN